MTRNNGVATIEKSSEPIIPISLNFADISNKQVVNENRTIISKYAIIQIISKPEGENIQ